MLMAKNKPKIHFRLNATKQLYIAIALFAFAAYLSRKSKFARGEEEIFNAIYGLPDILLPFFLVITQLGNVFILFGLSIFYIFRQQLHITLRLLLSGSLAYLLSGVAKDLFGRPRPLELLDNLVTRDLMVRGPGFPSGHSAMATAIALTIGIHLPHKHKWVVPAIIVGVGLSRIYLGVHAPLDVVGGIAIGWASAELFRHVNISERYRPKLKKR